MTVGIPAELEKARGRHPDVAILQSDYLGRHETISDILLKLALDEAGPEATSQSPEHRPA